MDQKNNVIKNRFPPQKKSISKVTEQLCNTTSSYLNNLNIHNKNKSEDEKYISVWLYQINNGIVHPKSFQFTEINTTIQRFNKKQTHTYIDLVNDYIRRVNNQGNSDAKDMFITIKNALTEHKNNLK